MKLKKFVVKKIDNIDAVKGGSILSIDAGVKVYSEKNIVTDNSTTFGDGHKSDQNPGGTLGS